jgi:hypothetical protein
MVSRRWCFGNLDLTHDLSSETTSIVEDDAPDDTGRGVELRLGYLLSCPGISAAMRQAYLPISIDILKAVSLRWYRRLRVYEGIAKHLWSIRPK